MQTLIQKFFRIFFILFCIFNVHTICPEVYPLNPYVKKATWNAVTPYLLPTDDPIKPILDKIFKKARVTASSESLKKAGFKHLKLRKRSLITVAAHPKLPGYLFKLFTDDIDKEDWPIWINRIDGANSVKRAIAKFKYEKHFTVPQKWIYPLPVDPPPQANGIQRKNFILIVEDMETLNHKGNRAQWKGPFMTFERLNAIFTIIDHEGLFDSVMYSNLPFDYKGKQSFIDTEFHHHWPIDYSKITPFLSSEKQKFWLQLIHANTP